MIFERILKDYKVSSFAKTQMLTIVFAQVPTISQQYCTAYELFLTTFIIQTEISQNISISNSNQVSSSKISLVVKIEEKLLRVLVDKEATIDDLAKGKDF